MEEEEEEEEQEEHSGPLTKGPARPLDKMALKKSIIGFNVTEAL